MIGKTLAHYEITEKIGAGGMGEVWCARDTKLDREVALKFVRRGEGGGRPQDALLREARAASALNHPNICTIHEVGESGSDAYIVMEYVEGRTLADRVGTFSPDEIIAIGTQIASALVHAHHRGVIHGDLKPANVMLGPEDRVKVLDFGLSRRVIGGPRDETAAESEAQAGSGGLAGTLAYISPEILRGGSPDERADLWALAVTLYEMCATARPFPGATPFEMSAAILAAAPAPLPASVPAPLRASIERGLVSNPGERFPDAAAVLRALESAVHGHPEAAAPAPPRTLAVLPFSNLSGDPSQEFFADGMTDAITAAIARLGSVRVISRTSAMCFKGERRSLPEIARQLHADAVVEGSVLRGGNRVRITAQLIDARTDEHLWTDSFDRDLSDILELQDDVALAIVRGIRFQFLQVGAADPAAVLAASSTGAAPPSSPAPHRGSSVDPAAYEEYLRGRHAWAKRTPASLHQAIARYRKAIGIDPTYARAHAEMAGCYAVLGFLGVASPGSSFPTAKAAARQALELDPGLATAHFVLGYVAMHHRWELDSAATAFEAGFRLDADDLNGHHWDALLATSRGDKDAALERMRLAAEVDPLSLIVRAATALILHFFGDFDAAAKACRDAIDLDPHYLPARWTLAKTMLARGEPDRALALLEPLVAEYERSPLALGDYGRALGLCGQRSRVEAVLEELRTLEERMYVRPYEHALIHMGLGEHDAALTRLEQALEEGGNWLNYLQLDPAFRELRDRPRFDALLRAVAGPAQERA